MSDIVLHTSSEKIKQVILPRDAVGKVIITKVPTVLPGEQLFKIIDRLPEFAQNMESINYVYVVNDKNRLKGVISVKELFQHPPTSLARDVMVSKLVVSHRQVNKKRVAYLAIKHNLKAVPIVDEKNHFIGVLSSDSLLTILFNQYRDSIRHFTGVISLSRKYETILEYGVLRNIVTRVPWILVGLIGGIFAAQVIKLFEETLSTHIVLALFIPLVVYISNAVGTQTQTFLVRDIAFSPQLDIASYFLKQLASSTVIGIICGIAIWLIISVFWGMSFIGFVVAIASFVAISLSTVIAVSIPYFLLMLKQEPASGSGPFATIIQDLLSIFVYFMIAAVLL